MAFNMKTRASFKYFFHGCIFSKIVFQSYLFPWRHLETTSLNDDNWKLKSVFGNHFKYHHSNNDGISKLYTWITEFGNNLLTDLCLETTLSYHVIGKLLVWMMVFGEYLFEWLYLGTTSSSDGICKLLAWMTVLQN